MDPVDHHHRLILIHIGANHMIDIIGCGGIYHTFQLLVIHNIVILIIFG
jgi:hypothetical protein